jgi:hypothetical protein
MSLRSGLLVVIAAATVHTTAAAQDISGRWSIAGESPGGSIHQALVLAQDGTALTGTVSETPNVPGGAQGGEAVAVQISDGTVLGKEFTFVITLEFGDNIEQRLYAGTFEGDSLQGTLRNYTGPSVPFTGKRQG